MNEPVWVDLPEVLAIHGLNIDTHGGPAGLRDAGLLESALARPRQLFAHDRAVDRFALAAVYAGGIIRNHPFLDGNKRTGFVVAVLFLELNGLHFRAAEADATLAVVELAAGRLEEAGFAAWLRTSCTEDR